MAAAGSATILHFVVPFFQPSPYIAFTLLHGIQFAISEHCSVIIAVPSDQSRDPFLLSLALLSWPLGGLECFGFSGSLCFEIRDNPKSIPTPGDLRRLGLCDIIQWIAERIRSLCIFLALEVRMHDAEDTPGFRVALNSGFLRQEFSRLPRLRY